MAPTYRYPIKKIGDQDDYFKIQVIEYKPPGLNLTGGFGLRTTEAALQNSIQNPVATIILPMPANIQDNNAADWVSGSMNPVVAGLGAAADSAVKSGNPIGSLQESILKGFSNLGAAINTGEGQQALAAGTAAAAPGTAITFSLPRSEF